MSAQPGDPMSDERLTALERRVTRLTHVTRMVGLALIATLSGAALLGVARLDEPAQLIRARRIQMVDDAGRVRAELGIDEDGSAGLFVRDLEARPRVAVVHDPSQSALYVLDAEGTIRVGAAQFAHGGGGFALHGAKSEGAAVLYLKNAAGSLSFFDEAGTLVERLPAPPKGTPSP